MLKKNFDVKPQQAMAFLIGEMTYVEQEVLRQPYPEIKYPRIIPIDESAPEYAQSIAFKTFDFAGKPKLLGTKGRDIPMVELTSGKGSVSVHTWALGYDYTLIELGEAMMIARESRSAAINLLVEKPAATRQLTEQWLDKVYFVGDDITVDAKTGLLNDPQVPVVDIGTLTGSSQTIDQILAGTDKEVVAQKLLDLFNNALLRVYLTQTNTVYRPTHFLLPPMQYGKIMTTRIPNTDETLMSYIKKVLSQGGSNIEFEPLLHLTGAGAGGADRMMVYTRDTKMVKGHMPMRFNLQAPATSNNVHFESAGIVRTAGTEIRVPKQHLYVDGL